MAVEFSVLNLPDYLSAIVVAAETVHEALSSEDPVTADTMRLQAVAERCSLSIRLTQHSNKQANLPRLRTRCLCLMDAPAYDSVKMARDLLVKPAGLTLEAVSTVADALATGLAGLGLRAPRKCELAALARQGEDSALGAVEGFVEASGLIDCLDQLLRAVDRARTFLAGMHDEDDDAPVEEEEESDSDEYPEEDETDDEADEAKAEPAAKRPRRE